MSRIHLERIEVRELFGRTFDGLRLIGLSSHVTVVYGPNAAGKTVLARGASQLLNATGKHIARSDRIVGLIRVEDESYEVDLAGPNPAPPWPQSSRVDLYRMSLFDLIDGPHEDDLRCLREALSGGFDFQRIAAQKSSRRPKQELEQSRESLQQKRQSAEDLRRQEAMLPALSQELEGLQTCDSDAEIVNGWLGAVAEKQQADANDDELAALSDGHPGIDLQAENAVGDAAHFQELYRESRKRLRDAGASLRELGGRRALQTLQAPDRAELARLLEIARSTGGALTEARIVADRAAADSATARQYLIDHAPESRRAPSPLSPADRQDLAERLSVLGRSAQVAAERNARREESALALATAQTHYRNAGGDPDRHPASAPTADEIQRLLELDAQLAEASGAMQRAKEAFANADAARQAAGAGLADASLPTPGVLQELQKRPSVAELMDKVRELNERKTAYGLVAYQLEKDAEAARQAAEGAEPAAQALRDWLRSIRGDAPSSRPVAAIVLAFVFAAAGAAVALAARPLAGAIVAALGLIVVAVLLLLRKPAARKEQRPRAARSVPERWRPAEWTPDHVAAQYAVVIDANAALAAVERAARDARTRAALIDDGPARQDLNDRLAAFARATGNKLVDGYDLADVIFRMQRLLEARQRLATADATRRHANERSEQLRADRRGALRATGAPGETGAGAKTWADALRDLVKAEAAHGDHAVAAATAGGEADGARKALADFFTRFGWPANGDASVARAGFEKWFELTQRLAESERAAGTARDQVERLVAALETTLQAIRELYRRYSFPCPGEPRDAARAFLDWFDRTATFIQARRDAKAARADLLGRLDAHGVPGGASLAARSRVPAERRDLADHRRQLVSQTRALRAKVSGARSQPGWEAAFDRLKLGREPGPQQLQAQRDQLDAGRTRLVQIRGEISATRALLDRAAQDNDLPGAERRLAAAVSALDAWLARKTDEFAGQAAKDWITEAVRVEAEPPIVQCANGWLKRFTGARYQRLDADEESALVADGLEESRTKTAAQLSTGTRAHLALAIRLAVIESAETSGHRFPLFLDEVMATSDPHASRAIAGALSEIADQRQVVVLTNHPEDLNLLRSVLGKALPVFLLADAHAPLYAPPALAPAAAGIEEEDGIPLASSIDQWPAAQLTALFPELDPAAPTVYQAMQRLEPARRDELAARLAAMEAVRARCALAHRRLRWADVESQGWITGAFRDRVHQALEDSRGDASDFLTRFCGLERMRDDKKRECERWIDENGYRTARPSIQDLADAARDKLSAACPDRSLVARGLAAFFADYALR